MLFIGKDNTRRSLMAESLLRFLQPSIEVTSAGVVAATRPDPFTVAVMRERHVEVGPGRPTQLTEGMLRVADVVVTFGPLPPTPFLTAGAAVEWDVPDLAGRPLDDYRRARANIENLIIGLIDDLETFRMLKTKRQGTADPSAPYFPGR